VTSAPLFEEQRELMQKAFGAPVCDQYGNTEIMLIAAECPKQKGLHIMQDTVHIEFVDENNQPVPPNTIGKILLTDLTNYAFPLIRYDIGDEGKYLEEPCSCGSPLPLMDNVRGRQALIIDTPSGLRIKGEHVMAMFNGYMKVFKEIQLIQEP
ncbi:MAG: phenylacetate--CoA ligase family protein, partial [Flavobacteriales bacterium]